MGSAGLINAMSSFKQSKQPPKKKEVQAKFDADILQKGGETIWNGIKISVHTDLIDSILPKYKFVFIDALGNKIFIGCTKKEKAQNFVNEVYGVGKYTVRISTD